MKETDAARDLDEESTANREGGSGLTKNPGGAGTQGTTAKARDEEAGGS